MSENSLPFKKEFIVKHVFGIESSFISVLSEGYFDGTFSHDGTRKSILNGWKLVEELIIEDWFEKVPDKHLYTKVPGFGYQFRSYQGKASTRFLLFTVLLDRDIPNEQERF